MPAQSFYSRGGQKVLGPCTTSELKIMASTGLLLPNDTVRRQEMVHPVHANSVKNLFDASAGKVF
jgi:hypothetical protein